MTKTLKLFILAIAAIAICIALPSCGDKDPEYSPLEDNWELVSIDGVEVSESQVIEFYIDADGSGTYGYYSHYTSASDYTWSTEAFTWKLETSDDGTTDYLYFYFNSGAVWCYIVTLYATEMKLTDPTTGQVLLFQCY